MIDLTGACENGNYEAYQRDQGHSVYYRRVMVHIPERTNCLDGGAFSGSASFVYDPPDAATNGPDATDEPSPNIVQYNGSPRFCIRRRFFLYVESAGQYPNRGTAQIGR